MGSICTSEKNEAEVQQSEVGKNITHRMHTSSATPTHTKQGFLS